MMGHKEVLKCGAEEDLVGHPEHRWRKYMPNNHSKWSYWKKRINKRLRREAKKEIHKTT